MKNAWRITLFCFVNITLYAPIYAQMQKHYGWYKVIESDNEKAWRVGSQFNISEANSDSILLTGFTDNMAVITGKISGDQISFPNARGTWRNGTITLSYSFQDPFSLVKGTITAEYFLPQFANQNNVNDTVIKGKWYQYALYDLNRNAHFIGEIFTGNIKNGHWLFFDHHELLIQSSQFINDTLNGESEFYTNTENKPRYKQSGLMVNGKKVGEFFTYEYRGKSWKKIGIESYDANGQRVYSLQLYPNGKPLYQTFYSPEGKAIWYRGYYKNGKLWKDDDVENTVVELL